MLVKCLFCFSLLVYNLFVLLIVLLIALKKHNYSLPNLQLSFFNLLLALAGTQVDHCLPLHDRELSRSQRSLLHLPVRRPHGTAYPFLGSWQCASGLRYDLVSFAEELSARPSDGHPPQTSLKNTPKLMCRLCVGLVDTPNKELSLLF